MTKYVVTDYDGCCFITAGKKYEVTFTEKDDGFHITDDNGVDRYCLERGCCQINEHDWTIIERDEDIYPITRAEVGKLIDEKIAAFNRTKESDSSEKPAYQPNILMRMDRAYELGIEELWHPEDGLSNSFWTNAVTDDVFGYPSEEYTDNLAKAEQWFREFCAGFDCVPASVDVQWVLNGEACWWTLMNDDYAAMYGHPIVAGSEPNELSDADRARVLLYRRICSGSSEEWV